jgi:hypothetical protein
MRLVSGIALIIQALTSFRGGAGIGAAIFDVLAATAGALLIPGLWTPIVGTLVTLIELWSVFSQAGDAWIPILLGTLGASLAMLGPGAWSFDARLFGWKRIDIRDREN